MSLRLTVQDSAYNSWRDKQLWLNITSLGFNRMNVGGNFCKNEERCWCSVIFGGGVVMSTSRRMSIMKSVNIVTPSMIQSNHARH